LIKGDLGGFLEADIIPPDSPLEKGGKILAFNGRFLFKTKKLPSSSPLPHWAQHYPQVF
jgi:hypothetical protein